MRILINSGKGDIDYTRHVLDGTLTIEDSINVPTIVNFQMSPADNSFVVPKRSSYVKLVSDVYAPGTGFGSGRIIATGFITTEPERTYLGITQDRGPFKFVQYAYTIHVTSDEWLLNVNAVPYIPAFVNQTDSQILSSLAQALAPGFYDVSQMATGTIVPYFQYDPTQTWSDIAKTFADQNRFHYKVLNRQILYQPFGDQPLGIAYDEQNQKEKQLFPLELKTGVITIPPVNDCIVTGDTEPQANWDNYFVGDGFTSNFQLKHQMFRGTSSNLLQDDWTETAFTQGTWIKNDPQGVITLVDGNGNALGSLNVVQQGATGVYTPPINATYVLAQNGLELGGGINLQHGQFNFNGACNGLLGSIFGNSTLIPGNVLAGFAVTGQQGEGPYTVSSVQNNANSSLVTLIISGGVNTLQPGNVIQCSVFVNATFLNGIKLSIQSITVNAGVYTLICQGIAVYPAAYGPTADSGSIRTVANDVLITASGAAGVVIQPMFSGGLVGPKVISQINHQYVLQTWIGANAPTRFTRPYTNLTRAATYGAQNIVASGDVTWVVTDVSLGLYVIQQQNPLFGLFPAAPPPVVTKFTLSNVNLPPFALYCLLNGINLNISINYTVISQPPQGFLTVQSLTGASGGHLPWLPSQLSPSIVYQLGFGMMNQTAQISAQGEAFSLSFYTDDIPSVGARIRFQSWSAGQSVARVIDPTAIANEASISGDNGVRSAIMSNISPLPRTSAECEAAAGAAILDREFPQFQGTYTVETMPTFESLFAPSLYQYPQTGRFFYINSPGRAVSGQNFFVNTVRIQVIELRQEVLVISLDYGPDLYLEKLLPSFLERESNILTPKQTVAPPSPITLSQVLNQSLPTLDNAQVIVISNSLTGNYITVDLGAPPITSCEVRYVDSGWGTPGQGRIGLFTAQQFTLPRTIRDQTWYLRTLNGSKFSRYSKALRVNTPLVPSAPGLVSNNSQSIAAALAGDVRDIYGLELRALQATGFSGSVIVQLPSNPKVSVMGLSRQLNLGIVPFTPPLKDIHVSPGQRIEHIFANVVHQLQNPAPTGNNTTTFFIGDILYCVCPTDQSYTGFRVVSDLAIQTNGPQTGYELTVECLDYGLPQSAIGNNQSQVATIQLVSRTGYAVLASGSMAANSVATLITRAPHGLSNGQLVCIGACWADVAPIFGNGVYSGYDNSLFTGVWQITVIDSVTFSFVWNNPLTPVPPGTVANTPLNGLVAGFDPSTTINLGIPGAPAGTILQRAVFAPSDLTIDLTAPDIADKLSVLESIVPGSRVGGLALYFFNLTWDYSAPTPIPSFTVPSISGLVVVPTFQGLNWGIQSGNPHGHRIETFDVGTGSLLSKYTIDHPSNPQILRQANMSAADWLNPRLIKVTPFDALGDGLPSFVQWGGSSGVGVIGGGGGSFGAGSHVCLSSMGSYGVGSDAFDLPDFSGFTVGVVNQIQVYLLVVTIPITISTITTYVYGNSTNAIAHLGFGLYSYDGNSLLVDGSSIFTMAAATNYHIPVSKNVAQVTLAAGAYWIAQSADQTGVSISVVTSFTQGGGNPSAVPRMVNKIATKMGIAANGSVAGVMPATLGTITPISAAFPVTALGGWAFLLFE